MTAEITVVIPHLGQWAQLDTCLEGLYRQTLERMRFKVIVIDNGTSDFAERRQEFHRRWPDVELNQQLEAGPGPARNMGIMLAQSPVIACIDADCIADENWLQTALNALNKYGRRTILGGNVRIAIKDPARPTSLEAYEAVFAFRQKLYIEKKQFSGTGNLAFWKEDYQHIGPFAGISLAEDRDWGLRAHAAGMKLRFLPEMIVFHPARPNPQALKAKWLRQIAHDLEAARSRTFSRILWPLRAVAVALSAFPHLWLVLRSDQLNGFRAHLRACAMLIRIRMFRAGEMLRQMFLSRNQAEQWNR